MRKKVLFTGGGTGGHVYPALAVIEKLKEQDFKIFWLGSSTGMEKRIIDQTGISFYSIPSGKLRRYFSFQNFTDIFKIIAGFFASLILLMKLRPDLVFSKGGFVTVPPVAAASILRIPVFTHDSDIVPGLATRINSVAADKVLLSSEVSKKYFSRRIGAKVFVTGNPVRSDFFKGDAERGKSLFNINRNKPVLLVMGGSSGAEQINKLLLDNLDKLTEKYYVIHQTGEKNFREITKENYYGAAYFHKDVAHLLAASDLVVSRAGASALWEFAAAALPSLLIPLESGSRGEQVKNAELFRDFGCSKILRKEISSETFMDSIENIMDNKDTLNNMKQAAQKISSNDSAAIISKMIIEVLNESCNY
ncbi:MAG: undecaprenyldiphospho-muramoylpentapeptide beta-N-acetylglucosaminyltransferase [Spirochaetaceae bacterium]|nr:undecaprenyldiphospho-muramoylpentapeptide beta-N-acetylglucosaminyltransferase [Spirochaetaceae bacterium]